MNRPYNGNTLTGWRGPRPERVTACGERSRTVPGALPPFGCPFSAGGVARRPRAPPAGQGPADSSHSRSARMGTLAGPLDPGATGARPLGLAAGVFTQRPVPERRRRAGAGSGPALRFHDPPIGTPSMFGGSRRVSATAPYGRPGPSACRRNRGIRVAMPVRQSTRCPAFPDGFDPGISPMREGILLDVLAERRARLLERLT